MNYYNHPAMSRSKIVDLDKMTPYKWYCKHEIKSLPQASTKALDFGSAFHCYVLDRNDRNQNWFTNWIKPLRYLAILM